jgi:hypothetical protein
MKLRNTNLGSIFLSNKIWRLWAKALGEKASDCDRESDRIAWIRTFLIVQSVVTNLFIITNFFFTHVTKQ